MGDEWVFARKRKSESPFVCTNYSKQISYEQPIPLVFRDQ
jgi:hypothetical protein